MPRDAIYIATHLNAHLKANDDSLPSDSLPTISNQSQQQSDPQTALSTLDMSREFQQSLENQQQQCVDFFTKQQQVAKDFMDRLEEQLNSKIKEEVSRQVAVVVQQQHLDAQVEAQQLKERVKQLEERLESTLTSSTSQTNTVKENMQPQRRQQAVSGTSGQLESVVRKLAEPAMQKQDQADKEARKKKELNAILRNFESPEGDSPEDLKVAVDALLSQKMETAVICVSAKRLQTKKDAALGNVLVQFEKKTDKHTVFKARAKLGGTSIGMDDDLTRLQQERKIAAWADFRAFRSQGIRTQWRAEKLFVLEGENFVEHKVPCL
ncbi:TPA: hypothetical protein ACH3X2_000352 [Trebouxia sp. C0005]